MKVRIALLSVVLISLPLIGQTFISAKAGLVNYEEGVQASSPRQLQEGEVFSTPNRSELLMMPGVYVRLERSAEVRMLSTSVSHPEVELLNGLVSIEVNELPKESSMSVSWGDYHDIPVAHRGLYRFEVAQDGSSLRVMVQTGQLRFGNTNLKDGEDIVLASGHVGSVSKFDRKLKDDFDLGSQPRPVAIGVVVSHGDRRGIVVLPGLSRRRLGFHGRVGVQPDDGILHVSALRHGDQSVGILLLQSRNGGLLSVPVVRLCIWRRLRIRRLQLLRILGRLLDLAGSSGDRHDADAITFPGVWHNRRQRIERIRGNVTALRRFVLG
jgi:hypothetical protein